MKNMFFEGYDVSLNKDQRLSNQHRSIFHLMKDGKERSLAEIERILHYPQASISAQLRHFRKERFGNHTVNRYHRNDVNTYQLIINSNYKV